MAENYTAVFILLVITASFFPGMIAANKGHSFSKWYIYALFLFPAALIHSILLKRPGRCLGVFFHDENSPSLRRKKVYPEVPSEHKKLLVSPGYILAVFFSKLIFGIFAAIALFAAFRTFANDTLFLRISCVNFAIVFSVFLGIVEICRFSRLPMIADEITKRALMFLLYSVICSLPLSIINTFIMRPLFPEYTAFSTFLLSALSMAIMIFIILRKQRMYYSFFSRFFDYCAISMIAYAIYAAITLIVLSVSETRFIVHAVALPMQVLNIQNLADMVNPFNLSFIYSSALAHLLVEIVIAFSGFSCYQFKRHETQARIEYRTTAFRMSRKRILRRHIPVSKSETIVPIQKI